MTLIKRLFVILFAFMAACLGAGIAVVMGEWFRGIAVEIYQRKAIDVVLWFISTMIGVGLVTPLPAMIVVGFTEAFKIRGALTYAVAGGLVGFACYLLLMPLTSDTLPFFSQDMPVVASAGVVAGLVYWMVAGRNAGAWRERQPGVSMPKRLG